MLKWDEHLLILETNSDEWNYLVIQTKIIFVEEKFIEHF
jgi:hypothetical protein